VIGADTMPIEYGGASASFGDSGRTTGVWGRSIQRELSAVSLVGGTWLIATPKELAEIGTEDQLCPFPIAAADQIVALYVQSAAGASFRVGHTITLSF
jgi:hypothetical protein